jgi:hypothetical protein
VHLSVAALIMVIGFVWRFAPLCFLFEKVGA